MAIVYTKRVRLTVSQKVAILREAETLPYLSCAALARWVRAEFKLPATPNKSTISRILKAKVTLLQQPMDLASRKTVIGSRRRQLDEAVVEFVMFAEVYNVSLTGAMITERAQELAAKLNLPRTHWPKFGPSWLRCLQERYGFSWRRAFGDSSSVDLTAAAAEIKRLKDIIDSYLPRNVFNMDESAFFYRAVPRGSICYNAAPAIKQNKDRITMAVCANADGSEKLPILYLGTATKPRWYSHKPASVHYFGAKKGWMTGWMYQQWLVALDERLRKEGRSILLLVDNASSHHETGLVLTNVRVEKLPANTTAKIQPMDQGIIHCIKREVLNKKMRYALDFLGEDIDNPYNVDMLTAILWCEEAWSNVSADTIQNCWHHSGLLNKASVSFLLS